MEVSFRGCEKSNGTALREVAICEDLVGGALKESKKKAPARGACRGGGTTK